MTEESRLGYDNVFIDILFRRLHGHTVSQSDSAGLAAMLKPIDELADAAARGLNFDDEPSDFIRAMNSVKPDEKD